MGHLNPLPIFLYRRRVRLLGCYSWGRIRQPPRILFSFIFLSSNAKREVVFTAKPICNFINVPLVETGGGRGGVAVNAARFEERKKFRLVILEAH